MQANTQLDNRLVRALREGADVLPEDLTLLRGYLQMIDRLLAEKAAELEPSWSMACAAAAEVATLQSLEAVVAERAIAVRADNLGAVRSKLEIWRALAAGAADGDLENPRNRLIMSVEADLERLSAARRD
jgi:hypothetical protein